MKQPDPCIWRPYGTPRNFNGLTSVWLSAPFVVEGQIRDEHGEGWGLLLSWHDQDGREHRGAVSASQMIGEPVKIEAELVDRGLSIAMTRFARDRLRDALASVRSPRRIMRVSRAGWHNVLGSVVYMLPNEDLIGQAPEKVILQGGPAESRGIAAIAGSLEEWQREVAAFAMGNDLLVFSLSMAFAGPLLAVTGDKSGGFHIVGGSQAGKTTSLLCAASVWGRPEMNAMVRSWRATANGLETTAAEASDALLPLDEIGQADGGQVAEVVYLLANESGKKRASRDGNGRPSRTWRLMFLSSGEEDLATVLAGIGKSVKAGQEVRMVNLRVPDAGIISGDLHGFENAAKLPGRMNKTVMLYHGTAARAFPDMA